MWDNIGRKLQSLAKAICWLGIVCFVILGIVIMTQSNSYQSTVLTGFIYIIFGCLGSWIGSWALYGLGVVVEHVENKGITNIVKTDNSDSSSTDRLISETSKSKDVQLLTERDKFESSILENALKEAGIPFFKKGKKNSGLDMSLGNDYSMFLFYVSEKNFKEADDIVKELFDANE